MKTLLTSLFTLAGLPLLAQTVPADLLVTNAKIYTVDAQFSKAEALAVKDGKVLETGSSAALAKKYKAAKTINAQGKFLYPGLIDAHAHFFRYGLGLQTADLTGTTSWNEVISRLQIFAQDKKMQPGSWILGRGWDQNDWAVKEFPNKELLDRYFPNYPVVLTRVDGHAAIANSMALKLAGVQPGQTLTGGSVETKNGQLTGILIDNATDLVYSRVPEPSPAVIARSVKEGEANCFAVGLTTVDDCGLDYGSVLFMDSLQKRGDLKMRVYAMLSDAKPNYEFLFARGAIKTDRMHVRSFKVYADGALGSRGASLLQPYSDRKDWSGFLLSNPEHFDSVAKIIAQNNFQMCTHAIGDSGNRTIRKIPRREK